MEVNKLQPWLVKTTETTRAESQFVGLYGGLRTLRNAKSDGVEHKRTVLLQAPKIPYLTLLFGSDWRPWSLAIRCPILVWEVSVGRRNWISGKLHVLQRRFGSARQRALGPTVQRD